MTEPTPPAWIRKRDGSLVPFEPDRISRALFAAGESLGRPDAFLARELTDSVVHFLTVEHDESTLTTAQLGELVVKVVRELGQPALAQAFADGAWVRTRHGKSTAEHADLPDRIGELVVPCSPEDDPESLIAACLRGYTLRTVFTRDLVAAQNDGLLSLHGLEAPFELAGCVLGPPSAEAGIFEAIEEARRLTGGLLAIDAPEHSLAHRPEQLAAYVRELNLGLRSARLQGVVNLNCAAPPSWADDLAVGPLFAEQQQTPEAGRLAAVADELLDRLLPSARIDWHLSERDLRPEMEKRLLDLARRALDGAALAFVFDRPRRPIALADGIDRQHPAALLTVDLHLPRLVDQVAGQKDAVARFLQKLGSLVRLALSAGVQKREFLRRRGENRPGMGRGFLLDRARLVVAPCGLNRVVNDFIGQVPGDGEAGLELARRIVERLHDVVREDGQSRHLEVCLDGSRLHENDSAPPDVKTQLRVASALYGAAELGTMTLQLIETVMPKPEQLVKWLRWAWKRTEVTRFRLLRRGSVHQQMTFDG